LRRLNGLGGGGQLPRKTWKGKLRNWGSKKGKKQGRKRLFTEKKKKKGPGRQRKERVEGGRGQNNWQKQGKWGGWESHATKEKNQRVRGQGVFTGRPTEGRGNGLKDGFLQRPNLTAKKVNQRGSKDGSSPDNETPRPGNRVTVSRREGTSWTSKKKRVVKKRGKSKGGRTPQGDQRAGKKNGKTQKNGRNGGGPRRKKNQSPWWSTGGREKGAADGMGKST